MASMSMLQVLGVMHPIVQPLPLERAYCWTAAVALLQEIVWSNLGEAGGVRGLRTLAAWAIFFVMCAFYLIPVGESLCCDSGSPSALDMRQCTLQNV